MEAAPTPIVERSQRLRLYLVIVTFWSSIYLFVPVMAPFAEYRGASLQTVGWLVSAYGLTQLLLRIPLGIWSDRLRARRPFIVAGFVASLIGALGMGYVESPHAMILFRGLTGVCASMWVMLSVWYASGFDAQNTSKAMGLAMMVSNSTQLASNLLGGFLADQWGWQAPFAAAAIMAVAGLFVTFSLREQPPETTAPPRLSELISMGRERLLLTVALLGALLQSIPYMSVYGFTTVYAAELGATKTQMGLITFAAGVPNALFAYLGGSYLVPRFGARKVIIPGFALAAVSLAFFPHVTTVWALLGLQALVGVTSGLVFPTLMGLSIQQVPAERRATAMGFFQSLYSLGMFGGPVLGGFLGEQFGLASVFTGASVVALTGLLCTVLLLRPRAGVKGSVTLLGGAPGSAPSQRNTP